MDFSSHEMANILRSLPSGLYLTKILFISDALWLFFSLYVFEFERLFYKFDYFFLIRLNKEKNQCQKKLMYSHLFFFTPICFFLLSEFLLSVNIICTLTSWSLCRKLIDQFFGIRLTFHGMGWSISNVSIFIYLQCRQWLGCMIRISRWILSTKKRGKNHITIAKSWHSQSGIYRLHHWKMHKNDIKKSSSTSMHSAIKFLVKSP